jgi:putative Mn2+ efflux pump MntP
VNTIVPLLLVGLSVGLGNFAASIAIGLGGISKALRVKIAVVFGLFETGMPILGLIVGHKVSGVLGNNASIIGGSLLVLMGIYLIFSALHSTDSKEVKLASQGIGKLLLAGLSLSIDNLVVGFGLGTHHESLWLAAMVIGLTSVVLALLGLELGSRLGRKIEEFSEVFSGVVLIAVGVIIGFKIL